MLDHVEGLLVLCIRNTDSLARVVHSSRLFGDHGIDLARVKFGKELTSFHLVTDVDAHINDGAAHSRDDILLHEAKHLSGISHGCSKGLGLDLCHSDRKGTFRRGRVHLHHLRFEWRHRAFAAQVPDGPSAGRKRDRKQTQREQHGLAEQTPKTNLLAGGHHAPCNESKNHKNRQTKKPNGVRT